MRMKRMRKGAVRPAQEVFDAKFIADFAATEYTADTIPNECHSVVFISEPEATVREPDFGLAD